MEYLHFSLNTRFKPSPSFVMWFTAGFFFVMLLLFLFVWLPLFLFGGLGAEMNMIVLSLFIFIILMYLYWVRLYYQSMWYELRDDEMSWSRGVWFHTTGIVPYNRITNLDIKQGPVMRMFGISTLAIQTAGYSGQAVPEIRIEAIEYADELRELIRTLVRNTGIRGDGTGSGEALSSGYDATSRQILDELKQIRSLLEHKL
jgi:uncharacterized protein